MWADVPTKIAQYDAEAYADNSNGTSASFKLLAEFNAVTLDDVPPLYREDFEKKLDYRLGACINLRNSRAWPIEWLRAI